MEYLKPNDQRAKTAVTLIWIVFLLELLCLVSSYMQFDLLQRAKDGDIVSFNEARFNDLREQIVSILYLLATIVSIVVFIQWFRRAYYNLHQKTDYLAYTEGWAAGAWFVPILCFYIPYKIMKELYVNTNSLLVNAGIINNNASLATSSLGLWWTLWIVSNFMGQLVFRYTFRAEGIEQLINGTVLSMISNVIGIPLALITIKIIRDYSKLEPLLFELKDGIEERPTAENIIA